MHKNVRSAILTLVEGGGENERVRQIGAILDCMPIAGEEVEAATKRCPRKTKAFDELWPKLCPGSLVRYGKELYRLHCRELLDRVKRGDDLRPGTDAEIAAVFSEASLRAPLKGDPAAAYSKVFARLFPEKFAEIGEVGKESYTGAVDELVDEVRRKLTRDR